MDKQACLHCGKDVRVTDFIPANGNPNVDYALSFYDCDCGYTMTYIYKRIYNRQKRREVWEWQFADMEKFKSKEVAERARIHLQKPRPNPEPTNGDQRIREKFFYRPRNINGTRYWLSHATVKEEFCDGRWVIIDVFRPYENAEEQAKKLLEKHDTQAFLEAADNA